MARMFGLISNRSDIGAKVLNKYREALCVKREGRAMGWGIGFYQSGEVLLRRRPIDEREMIDLAEAAEDVRSDILIGHVRAPSIGALRTENTHPFRYRQWLFAQTGTIAGFDRLKVRLLESQPEFLRRNVRGDTDSELFFYLFLSFLHDAGHLDETAVAPKHIHTALRASIALVNRLSAEEGHAENIGDILVTNGETLILVHRGGSAAMKVFKGRYEIESLVGDKLAQGSIASLDYTHVGLIASGLDTKIADFEPVTDKTIATFSRTDDPIFESL